ncbi:pantoate--beta-alanine ligase [Flavobacterium chuncheonense]|uniref:Pantothenate synthetase n=1 Tax=Flavobacterium chuncheonense TaxID=2026653 RepID=A0ABW5YNL9_9FLAO
MLVFNNKAELQKHLAPLKRQKKTIGFVPTMGALHKGHLSLINRSLSENDVTVMSIFVNPTQFNNLEDLEKYPRTLESDVDKIQTLSNEVIVYAPSVNDIYGKNTESDHFSFDGLEDQMEGQHRPGHFDGVGTIVKKLFQITTADKAYFGEKDFQQLQIVKKLVEKEQLPTQIIGCPIFREESGLAMSSRNERLSTVSREKAAIIYQTLKEAKQQFSKSSAPEVIAFVKTTFEKHPEFTLEYFEIADEATLLPIETKDPQKDYRGFIAIFIDNIRLIDNISMK